MMLIARLEGKRVPICNAVHGEPYTCPECGMPVVPHKGRKVVHHYKHKVKSDCPYGAGETREHLEAKTILQNAFISRGLTAEPEVFVRCLSQFGDRRADVIVCPPPPKKGRVAVELQRSVISVQEFEARSKAYAKGNVHVLWIPFVERKTFNTDDCRQFQDGSKRYRVERYSARPWEKRLFKLIDKVWYYAPKEKNFWKASISPCLLDVPYSEFYSSDGDLQSFGGYSRESERWVELTLRGPYSPESLKVQAVTVEKGKYKFAQFVEA